MEENYYLPLELLRQAASFCSLTEKLAILQKWHAKPYQRQGLHSVRRWRSRVGVHASREQIYILFYMYFVSLELPSSSELTVLLM